MEPVEYLMVGEAAEFEVVVDKSFVQCLVYRREGEFQDFLQSFLLFLAVGEQEYAVAFRHIGIELVSHDVEVFVEERLCCGVECYCRFCFEECPVSEGYCPEIRERFCEVGFADDMFFAFVFFQYFFLLHFCCSLEAHFYGLRAESFFVYCADAVVDELEVFECHDGILRHEIEHGHFLFVRVAEC